MPNQSLIYGLTSQAMVNTFNVIRYIFNLIKHHPHIYGMCKTLSPNQGTYCWEPWITSFPCPKSHRVHASISLGIFKSIVAE